MWENAARSRSRQCWPAAVFLRPGLILLALWLPLASGVLNLCGIPSHATAAGDSPRGKEAAVPGSTSGGAKNGTISGRVIDDSGKPISTADIVVTPVGTRVGQRKAETDDDGKFSVTDLDSTVYRVTAQAPSFVDSEDDSAPLAYRPGDTADIRLIKGGVITGNVIGADGGPVVAVEVHAIRVKDANGRPVSQSDPESARRTDDRGIYRIYGLRSGSYFVYAGGPEGWSEGIAYIGDAPTYYPSSTIDTAEEVAVGTGQEITGVNINYRAERGHTVSGSVVDSLANSGSARNDLIFLRQANTANIIAQSYVGQNSRDKSFSISGVPDGQYEILAGKFGDGGLVGASQPTRLTVKGGDVTGVSLVVAALGSISGTVTLAPLPAGQKAACKPQAMADLLRQTAIVATADKAEGTLPFPGQGDSIWGAIDEKGHFMLAGFPPGTHHLELNLPGDSWYVSSIERTGDAQSQDTAGAQTKAAAGDTALAGQQNKPVQTGGTLELKPGQKIEDMVVTLAEGAATLKGQVKIAAAKGGAKPSASASLRVYLVPDDPDQLKNPVRFLESTLNKDSTFEIHRIPPGKYKAVAQPEPLEKDKPGPVRRASWDAALRKRLTGGAVKITDPIELKTCGNASDYSVTYDPAAQKSVTRAAPAPAPK